MIYTIATGRLGRDPEEKQANGKLLVKISIASDRVVGQGQKETDWLSCTAWEKRGEFVSKYFRKGDSILVRGNLKSRIHEGKTYWEMDVEKADFCGGKSQPEGPRESLPTPSEADDTSLPFDL